MAFFIRVLASVRRPSSLTSISQTSSSSTSSFITQIRGPHTPRRACNTTMTSRADESYVTHLAEIPTLGEQYRKSVLTAAEPGSEKFKANLELNERVSLYQGDITQIECDAIVNAANKSLLGGGGVDGAIHRAAGAHLLEECRTLNGCSSGDAKITRGYCLPAHHVIHTVGPIWSSTSAQEHAEVLESCYQRSLEVAIENSCAHIAFPAISTGIYSYPIKEASHIALGTVRRFLETEAASKIERVIFVVWSNNDLGVYESLIPEYFPPDPAAYGQDDVPVAEPEPEEPSSTETNEKQNDEAK